MKKSPDALKVPITFRVSENQLKKLNMSAHAFTNGDRSEYIRWCLFNYIKCGQKKEPVTSRLKSK